MRRKEGYLSKGRVNIKEELALYVPTGMFAKVGFIPPGGVCVV